MSAARVKRPVLKACVTLLRVLLTIFFTTTLPCRELLGENRCGQVKVAPDVLPTLAGAIFRACCRAGHPCSPSPAPADCSKMPTTPS